MGIAELVLMIVLIALFAGAIFWVVKRLGGKGDAQRVQELEQRVQRLEQERK